MKSLKTLSCRVDLIRLLPAFFCAASLMLATGRIAAQKPAEEKKEQAEPKKQDRLVSLVLLLREPRQLDEHTLANTVSEAVGIAHSHDKNSLNFVVAKPPYYQVKLKSNRFIVNNIDKPYFEEGDKLAEEIKDLKLRKAVTEHRAWLSIDWAEKEAPADLKTVYQEIGKMAVALAGPDTLAVYSPDTDRLSLYNKSVAKQLKGEDPLQAFAGAAASNVISISSDDPKLKAAEAEAKKRWPEFVNAFKEKDGDKFAVKGRIVEGDNAEYMWLSVTAIGGEEIHGKLDNEPAGLTKLKLGQDLHIKIDEVDDWLYVGSDKQPRGGFTMEALKEARK